VLDEVVSLQAGLGGFAIVLGMLPMLLLLFLLLLLLLPL
jgi:hypothetical protein